MTAALRLFAVFRVQGSAWQADRAMQEQDAWQQHAAFMNLRTQSIEPWKVLLDRDATTQPRASR